ncbi:MAG TPA: hypothetical protein VFI24_21410 [Pyrinomonadaceae bacterium]|nr:hypothetical protein [Pyrinomonadaceae bacterium]
MKFKRMIAVASIFVVSMFATSGATVAPQEAPDRMTQAKGQGTLKLGQEQFKITAIIVTLLDDGRAELRLVSDIIVFVSGTWTQDRESQEIFDLQITGGATPGGLQCTGKVTLPKDTKDVQLILKGMSRTTKRPIEVYFVGK